MNSGWKPGCCCVGLQFVSYQEKTSEILCKYEQDDSEALFNSSVEQVAISLWVLLLGEITASRGLGDFGEAAGNIRERALNQHGCPPKPKVFTSMLGYISTLLNVTT